MNPAHLRGEKCPRCGQDIYGDQRGTFCIQCLALDLLEHAESPLISDLCPYCGNITKTPAIEPHEPNCPWLELMQRAGRRDPDEDFSL